MAKKLNRVIILRIKIQNPQPILLKSLTWLAFMPDHNSWMVLNFLKIKAANEKNNIPFIWGIFNWINWFYVLRIVLLYYALYFRNLARILYDVKNQTWESEDDKYLLCCKMYYRLELKYNIRRCVMITNASFRISL